MKTLSIREAAARGRGSKLAAVGFFLLPLLLVGCAEGGKPKLAWSDCKITYVGVLPPDTRVVLARVKSKQDLPVESKTVQTTVERLVVGELVTRGIHTVICSQEGAVPDAPPQEPEYTSWNQVIAKAYASARFLPDRPLQPECSMLGGHFRVDGLLLVHVWGEKLSGGRGALHNLDFTMGLIGALVGGGPSLLGAPASDQVIVTGRLVEANTGKLIWSGLATGKGIELDQLSETVGKLMKTFPR
jgi:hypothetical protein